MPSAMNELMYKEIEKELAGHPYAFISQFDSLSVAAISELRSKLAKAATRSLVVKHALVQKVFEKQNLSDAAKHLKGCVVVTFGKSEPQAISKTLIEFAKTNNKFASAGVIFEGKVYDQAYIKQLASLPSRQELLTQVVVRVKSPITGFVLTLGQLLKGVVVALNEVKKKKEAQPAA